MAFFSKGFADIVRATMVPTGKKVGGGKKKRGMGGLMAKAAKEVVARSGGGRERANPEEEGNGRGLLSSVRRAIKRRAY